MGPEGVGEFERGDGARFFFGREDGAGFGEFFCNGGGCGFLDDEGEGRAVRAEHGLDKVERGVGNGVAGLHGAGVGFPCGESAEGEDRKGGQDKRGGGDLGEAQNAGTSARKRVGHRRPACVWRMARWFRGVRCEKERQSLHGRDGHAPFFCAAILTVLAEAADGGSVKAQHEEGAGENADGDEVAELGDAGDAGEVQGQKSCRGGGGRCPNAGCGGGAELGGIFAESEPALGDEEAVVHCEADEDGGETHADDRELRVDPCGEAERGEESAGDAEQERRERAQAAVGEKKQGGCKGDRTDRGEAHVAGHGGGEFVDECGFAGPSGAGLRVGLVPGADGGDDGGGPLGERGFIFRIRVEEACGGVGRGKFAHGEIGGGGGEVVEKTEGIVAEAGHVFRRHRGGESVERVLRADAGGGWVEAVEGGLEFGRGLVEEGVGGERGEGFGIFDPWRSGADRGGSFFAEMGGERGGEGLGFGGVFGGDGDDEFVWKAEVFEQKLESAHFGEVLREEREDCGVRPQAGEAERDGEEKRECGEDFQGVAGSLELAQAGRYFQENSWFGAIDHGTFIPKSLQKRTIG